MNGFVLVDMLSGQCIFSMMFEEGFGLGSLQQGGGGAVEEATVAAHFAGMSFSLMLQAINLVGTTDTVPTTSASRSAYFKELLDRPALLDEAYNAAPMQLVEAMEGTSLCYYLHPNLPVLSAVSTTSQTTRLGTSVAEATVKLFVKSHAEAYFTSGQQGAKKLRKALSAPIKLMYQELLKQELETRCQQQLQMSDDTSEVGEWRVTAALDTSHQSFGALGDTHVATLCGLRTAAHQWEGGWGEPSVQGCRIAVQSDLLMNTVGHLLMDPVSQVVSALTRDPRGHCSVVLCSQSFAMMLTIAPHNHQGCVSPDTAALHCSWAESEFSLWATIFQFASTHRLNLSSPQVAS